MCLGDTTRIFFRVLAWIAALPDLNLRLFSVSTAHLDGNLDGEVYMESPSEYGDRGSVLEGDGTRPRAETHVHLINPNHIQIIRVYTSFRSCAWPAGVLVVEEGMRENDDKAREVSDLYLQLGGPITEPPNGGTQLWTLSTLNLVLRLPRRSPSKADWNITMS